MHGPRQKALWLALGAVVVVWLLAWGGYTLARHAQVTPEKIAAYLRATDLRTLRGEARAAAIARLARMLNALSYEDRRSARLDRAWGAWFQEMTDDEKSGFLDATFPPGMKQMLTAFEQLPEVRRRRTIEDALKRLREAQSQRASLDGQDGPAWGTNPPPVLSEEMRTKMVTMGLRAFYGESTAQTKAEAAPLLEELQRMMESGRMLRGR